MFSGEEMRDKLAMICNEIGQAPDLEEIEPDITTLAIFAGQADAALGTIYRMVCNLIVDIEAEMVKDEQAAEENRKWWEAYKAKEAAAQEGEAQEAPDAE